MEDPARPNSGMRGRATRRGAPGKASAANADAADNGADDVEDDGQPASWKVELESIMSGTHPALVEALEPHDQKMKAIVSQADRVRQLQMVNINALFDCEKKQADDENKVRAQRARTRPGGWQNASARAAVTCATSPLRLPCAIPRTICFLRDRSPSSFGLRLFFALVVRRRSWNSSRRA